MQLMHSLFCFGILLLVPLAGLHAQQYLPVSLPDTEVRTVASGIVDADDYKIYIALPDEYSSSAQNFPAVYILDASNQFAMAVQIYRLLRILNEVPPLILVGIVHERNFLQHRSRDFTPTSLTQEEARKKYGDFLAGMTPVSGNAPVFLRFIKEELIPFVESNYRVDSTSRGLFGHSYGGLFSAYALFAEPELFQKVLISGAALWWDDEAVFLYEEQLAKSTSKLEAKVLAVVGADEEDDTKAGWERLRDLLQSRKYEGLQIKAMQFAGESHASVIPMSFSYAFRFLYGELNL